SQCSGTFVPDKTCADPACAVPTGCCQANEHHCFVCGDPRCGDAPCVDKGTCSVASTGGVCGVCNNDGTCDTGENCSNCPGDCGVCIQTGCCVVNNQCSDSITS